MRSARSGGRSDQETRGCQEWTGLCLVPRAPVLPHTRPPHTMTEIAYRIRRSERARRVRVTVDARGVEVVLPPRAPEREAAAAVRELEPWIRRRMQERRRARAGRLGPVPGPAPGRAGRAGAHPRAPAGGRAAGAGGSGADAGTGALVP